MNKIYLQGIASHLEFSHENRGEKFYSFIVTVKRRSGVEDTLNCITPEINLPYIYEGKTVGICGEIRTRNVDVNGKSRLEIYVFVKETGTCGEKDTNYAELQGFICKKPNLRETPLGRTICDVFMAINRPSGKSDYIPCIFWGRQAVRVSDMEVGTEVAIGGRMQSRDYTKENAFGDLELKTAYEFSVSEFKGV